MTMAQVIDRQWKDLGYYIWYDVNKQPDILQYLHMLHVPERGVVNWEDKRTCIITLEEHLRHELVLEVADWKKQLSLESQTLVCSVMGAVYRLQFLADAFTHTPCATLYPNDKSTPPPINFLLQMMNVRIAVQRFVWLRDDIQSHLQQLAPSEYLPYVPVLILWIIARRWLACVIGDKLELARIYDTVLTTLERYYKYDGLAQWCLSASVNEILNNLDKRSFEIHLSGFWKTSLNLL